MAEAFLSTRRLVNLPGYLIYRGGKKTLKYDRRMQKERQAANQLPSSRSLFMETHMKNGVLNLQGIKKMKALNTPTQSILQRETQRPNYSRRNRRKKKRRR